MRMADRYRKEIQSVETLVDSENCCFVVNGVTIIVGKGRLQKCTKNLERRNAEMTIKIKY